MNIYIYIYQLTNQSTDKIMDLSLTAKLLNDKGTKT